MVLTMRDENSLSMIGPLAARALLHAARSGWHISSLKTAQTGSVYFDVRRGGLTYRCRVSDHRSLHWWKRKGRRIDFLTFRSMAWAFNLLAWKRDRVKTHPGA